MNDYAALILGVVCDGIGGELFVRGAVGLAHWARVTPAISGATVAAFATSSPELSVSINAALAGKPQIALGDALGSNVVNVALILGLALVISGIQSPRDSIKRDCSRVVGRTIRRPSGVCAVGSGFRASGGPEKALPGEGRGPHAPRG